MRAVVRAATATAFLVFASCGSNDVTSDATSNGTADKPEQRYQVVTTVLESPAHGPELCVGAVAESLPPQCGGIPIDGWDWNGAEGHQSASGTTWGTYRVIGTFDGERFRVTEPPEPATFGGSRPDDYTSFATPCPEPEGGWAVSDPAKVGEGDFERMSTRARNHDDFAGLWLDQSRHRGEPGHGAPGYSIVNVAFTSNVDAREAELRELWGGPLCVTRHQHSLSDLRRIQDELSRRSESRFDVVASSVDEVENVVRVTVVVADRGTRAELERSYGEGVVEVDAILQPLG